MYSVKNAVAALAVLSLASLSNAQSTGGITANFPCAASCINTLIYDPTCNPSQQPLPDPNCICKSQTLIDTVSCCIYQLCDEANQQKALQFARGACGSVANNVLPQSAGCSGLNAAQSSAATVPLSDQSATTAGASTTTSSGSTAATTTSTSSGSETTSAGAQATSSTPSSTSGTPTSPNVAVAKPTAVAAAGVAGAVVGLAGLFL